MGMCANQQSVIGWLRLLLAVALCVSVTSRVSAQDTQSPAAKSPAAQSAAAQSAADDQVALGERDETWLDPTGDEADGCDMAGPGGFGWLGRRLPHFRVRHIGLGEPLEGTSWLNRPAYVGAFLGESFGSTLVAGEIDVRPSAFGGLWLGYDLNHYWGSEIRLGLNYAKVQYVPDGRLSDNSRNALADINLLYYPWGDSRWRPYAAVGLGIGGYHFDDDPDLTVDHTGVALPLGCGVKYLWGRQLVVRLDLKDNLLFGGHGVDTGHNWSLTAGFEFHWGSGSSAEYYPW